MFSPRAFLVCVAVLSPPFFSTSGAAETARGPSRESLVTTPAEREARLGWWREARFGMFVHWGVSSTLGGAWRGRAYGGYSEHIQRMAKIPIPVYHGEVAGSFNPVHFEADTWIRVAKEAGMGYFVITAKHHDGFAMYDSKVSEHTVVKATPFARDPMVELREACRRHGVKFGFYYSHAFDWGEADAPGNDWDYENPGGDRRLHGSEWWKNHPEFLPRVRRYVDEKSIPQIIELIRNHDPDILWFDTPHKLPPEENQRIMAAVRAADPSLVVNGRLIYGLGDYASTCDKPAEFPPHDGDWEGIPTTNESYGYNAGDRSHKPPAHFIRLLAKAVARGGNLLLNIGPRGDGTIDPVDLEILGGVGAWWSVNHPSIRGAGRTPLAAQSWGVTTRRDHTLYLHVFDWPADGRLHLGGLGSEVRAAQLLAAPGQALRFEPEGADLVVHLPASAPDPADTVVALECATPPEAGDTRLLAGAHSAHVFHVFDGRLSGGLEYGTGERHQDWAKNWKSPDAAVSWTVRVKTRGTYAVAVSYDTPAARAKAALVEGPAGKELAPARAAAGGSYAVRLGAATLPGEVKPGTDVTTPLGSVTLEPGRHEFRVETGAIAGDELFRLRSLILRPLPPAPDVTASAPPSPPLVAADVTAPDTGDNQLLYFTSPSLTDDDRHLVFIGDRTGHPNLFVRDLRSGEERQLTRNTEGVLKSYVYFDGIPYRGFGKGSVSLDPTRGIVYYIQGREVRAVTLEGVERVLATLPVGQMTAFTHVSADGKRLCVPTVDARALDDERILPAKPDFDIDRRVVAEGLSSYLRVYDTTSGRELSAEPVRGGWVTHVQFSPINPDLILYNHEYCADSGIRRMWLWDGRHHLRLRTVAEGREARDWACHEMWERDGSAIIYHGAFHEGPGFVGRVRPDGSDTVEIALPEAWKSYGHYTVGRPGELVADGSFLTPDDTGWGGAWLSHLRVDWGARRIAWTPLLRHGSSWTSQDCHPHPVFNHAADSIFFTSDAGGPRSIRRVPAPR